MDVVDKSGLHDFLAFHQGFLLMALAHHIRREIMFIKKLEIEATTTMSNDYKVFMLLLNNKLNVSLRLVKVWVFTIPFSSC